MRQSLGAGSETRPRKMEEDIRKKGMLYLQQQRFGKVRQNVFYLAGGFQLKER